MICIHAGCPPVSCTPLHWQSQLSRCNETDWTSLPPQKGRRLKKGGYDSCFGLSTFHLETVKWYPQSSAEGMEAGQHSLFPPLIHAPCSFTSTCRFEYPFHHKPLICYLTEMSRNKCNKLNQDCVSFLNAVTLRKDPMQCHHNHSNDVILERRKA